MRYIFNDIVFREGGNGEPCCATVSALGLLAVEGFFEHRVPQGQAAFTTVLCTRSSPQSSWQPAFAGHCSVIIEIVLLFCFVCSLNVTTAVVTLVLQLELATSTWNRGIIKSDTLPC